MSHRLFTDSNNVTWLVLAVYPHVEERRAERERRWHDLPVGTNRRHARERRQRVRREMERGWMVFKAEGGRRRLTPIVDGWDQLPDSELERLCYSAVPVQRRGGFPLLEDSAFPDPGGPPVNDSRSGPG